MSRLLLLTPQLYGSPGGVPAYMQRLVDICSAYCEGDGRLVCASMLDPEKEPDSAPRNVIYTRRSGKPGYVKRVLEVAWTHKPDLVIAGHLGMAPVAWLLRKMGWTRSYILVLHGIEAWRKADWMDGLAARQAALVVATTRYTAEEFAGYNGVDPRRIRVIPLGLAENHVEPPASPASGSSLQVLTVGRLWAVERYKGVDTLIEALAECRRSGADVRLTVVGSGDDLPRLKALCESKDVSEHVRFLGSVSEETLRACYAACDVFAMPSRGEGFGIVFLEAMRWGKPCIGGNHGGTPEVIHHGVDGYLVDHGNMSRLAQYMQLLASRPDLRQRMGDNARGKIASRYLYRHLEERWRALLDEALTL